MADKSLSRQQMSLARKSLRKFFRGIGVVPEHLAWLGASLRENREVVARMNEAMCARAQAASVVPHADSRGWQGEWDAIEHGLRGRRSKVLALRLLFEALLAQRSLQPEPAAAGRSSSAAIDVAPGELLDRLTILEIKLERIQDAAKLRNVRKEHDLLVGVCRRAIPAEVDSGEPRARLKAVNERIWQLEDDIRQHERDKNFGPSFVALARAVYRTNDERAAIKRQINDALLSEIIEEKSYQPY